MYQLFLLKRQERVSQIERYLLKKYVRLQTVLAPGERISCLKLQADGSRARDIITSILPSNETSFIELNAARERLKANFVIRIKLRRFRQRSIQQKAKL